MARGKRWRLARRMALAGAMGLIVSAAWAGTAWAGGVSYTPGYTDELGGMIPDSVLYVDAGNEANRVSAFASSGHKVILEDRGNVILPDPNGPDIPDTLAHCITLGSKATCSTSPRPDYLDIYLGNGNDVASILGPLSGALLGGAGADVLKAGDAGGDHLLGGPGPDDMHGGGGCCDTVDYTQDNPGAASGVTVTLDDIANDGQPGEGDNVHSDVEYIDGTNNGDDSITGTDADNRFYTLGGSDRLDGAGGDDDLHAGAGDDVLVGGPGADILDGSIGDDTIDARDGEVDRILCSDGFDTVFADAVDQLSDCEDVHIG